MAKYAWAALTLVICLGNLQAAPDGFKTLKIGAKAPDFTLPGVDDKSYSLSDFDEAKILLVIFTCNHCPTAQAYEVRIKQIYNEYHPKGVALVAISPNDAKAVRLDELGYSDLGDSLEDMKIRAKEAGFQFPYLYDGETQKTSLEFGVLATPHAFIFDSERKLRYKGRIDDSEVKAVKSHDVRNALDALLAGKPVPQETTRVFGCSTKWSDKRESAIQSLNKWDREPVELSLISPTELKKLSANDTKNYRLINLWATWCTPCLNELDQIARKADDLQRLNVNVLALNVGDETGNAERNGFEQGDTDAHGPGGDLGIADRHERPAGRGT